MKPRTRAALAANLCLLSLGLLWVLPATLGSEARTLTLGEARTLEWPADADRTTTFRWTFDLNLREGDRVVPSHFLHIFSVDGEQGELNVRLTHTANGKEVYRWSHTLAAEGGVLSYEPSTVAQVKQTEWVSGKNSLAVEVRVQFDSFKPGPGTVSVEAGPARITIHEADRDHDGVSDSRQLVPGVHSGWLVLGASTLILGATVFMGRRSRASEASEPQGPQRLP